MKKVAALFRLMKWRQLNTQETVFDALLTDDITDFDHRPYVSW